MARVVSLLLAALPALALVTPRPAEPQGAQLPPAIEMRVPKPPAVAAGDSASFLAYELHVTNMSPGALTLRRVEVLDAAGGESGRVLLALDDSALARALARPGVSPAPALGDRPRVGGGLRAVAFLWVRVDGRTPPRAVRHRLTVGQGDSGATRTLEGPPTPVTNDAVVIGPPLRGSGWLSANGPDPASGHRRSLIPVGGTPAIAQRFAIDYVKLDSNGRSFAGDQLKNESYFAEGVDAIAVADGVVSATKDSIPENVPGITSRAVPITLETVGGNHVILDIGQGRYAFYAHLKPGSLRVRVGDRVGRGQVLGLVGNSGNSTEPHLHFHISDGPSPLGAEGLPYVHETFELVGRCALGRGCTPAAGTRRREMPMANMLVRFPEGR